MRYTDKELSLVLSEHAAETLSAGGATDWGLAWYPQQYPLCCANQAAFNTPSAVFAGHLNPAVAKWFDGYYRPDMSAEALLQGIETARRGK